MPPLKCLVLYFSPGGNTKKVAEAIAEGLTSQGADVTLGTMIELKDEIPLDYDFVCLGAPSYHYTVPAPVKKWIEAQMKIGNEKGWVRPGAPQRPGKWGASFITYGGPHSGMGEAKPAGDQLTQTLVHLGFQVRCEWYFVGEFHNKWGEPLNMYGYLGDIRGRPDEHDLAVAKRNAAGLAFGLQHELERVEKDA